MQSLWSIGFGLLSGVVGWMISEFLAKPFRRGIDLIAEARTSVLVYANVQARAKMTRQDGYAAHEEAEERLLKAEEALRELGAKMQAFAGTDRAAAFILRALGANLRSAGIALIGFSNSIGIVWAAKTRCTKTSGHRTWRAAVIVAAPSSKTQRA
jgi:hypothetical protein